MDKCREFINKSTLQNKHEIFLCRIQKFSTCAVYCVYHTHTPRKQAPMHTVMKKRDPKKKRDRDKTWDMFLCQMNWFVRKLKIRTISNSFYLFVVFDKGKSPCFVAFSFYLPWDALSPRQPPPLARCPRVAFVCFVNI